MKTTSILLLAAAVAAPTFAVPVDDGLVERQPVASDTPRVQITSKSAEKNPLSSSSSLQSTSSALSNSGIPVVPTSNPPSVTSGNKATTIPNPTGLSTAASFNSLKSSSSGSNAITSPTSSQTLPLSSTVPSSKKPGDTVSSKKPDDIVSSSNSPLPASIKPSVAISVSFSKGPSSSSQLSASTKPATTAPAARLAAAANNNDNNNNGTSHSLEKQPTNSGKAAMANPTAVAAAVANGIGSKASNGTAATGTTNPSSTSCPCSSSDGCSRKAAVASQIASLLAGEMTIPPFLVGEQQGLSWLRCN